jgi:uncharacterized membrane protein HdeD (DUF308 family)
MDPNGTMTIEGVQTALKRSVHDHWRMFLAEGVVLIVLGLGAMMIPFVAGLATTVFLGWLFAIAGVAGLVSTFRSWKAPGSKWALLSAIAALVVACVLLFDPVLGLVTLTYVLTAYFILDGCLVISLAISHRREMSKGWGWMLVNGLVDLFIALMILTGMPGSLVWVLGLFVGIDLLFGGFSLMAMSLEARKQAIG